MKNSVLSWFDMTLWHFTARQKFRFVLDCTFIAVKQQLHPNCPHIFSRSELVVIMRMGKKQTDLINIVSHIVYRPFGAKPLILIILDSAVHIHNYLSGTKLGCNIVLRCQKNAVHWIQIMSKVPWQFLLLMKCNQTLTNLAADAKAATFFNRRPPWLFWDLGNSTWSSFWWEQRSIQLIIWWVLHTASPLTILDIFTSIMELIYGSGIDIWK